MITFSQPVGPWQTFSVLKCGTLVATVRRVRQGQWLLKDLGIPSFDSTNPKVKGKTQYKGFVSKTSAISFINIYYS
jgi:hypothetical protein